MRSIRRTLLAGTLAGTTATFLAAGFLVYARVEADLHGELDRALAERARLLASTVELEDGRIDMGFMELDTEGSPDFLQLRGEDGRVLFRSPTPASGDLQEPRSLTLRFHPRTVPEGGKAPEITLVLARGTGAIRATLSSLRDTLILSGALALAVAYAALWWAIRRGLKPLDDLAGEIGRLDAENLSAKVVAGGSVRELSPVTTRVNDLLARIRAVLVRERAFSDDVAHELRTPVAGLRSILEVALSRPREAAAYREALQESRPIAEQMQRLVENLLLLARLEAAQTEIRREPVRPHPILREAWKPLQSAAEARRLSVEWALGPEAEIPADPSLVQLLARNLLENAVAYADEEGRIRIETRADGFSVSNTGSRLTQEQAEKAFERFWRGDEARSAAGEHCGLGLALVRKAASALGGSVRVRSSVGGEFEVSVTLAG